MKIIHGRQFPLNCGKYSDRLRINWATTMVIYSHPSFDFVFHLFLHPV